MKALLIVLIVAIIIDITSTDEDFSIPFDFSCFSIPFKLEFTVKGIDTGPKGRPQRVIVHGIFSVLEDHDFQVARIIGIEVAVIDNSPAIRIRFINGVITHSLVDRYMKLN